MDTPNDTLVCTKCGNEYPATLEYFPADKRNRRGYSSWCRSCHRSDSRQRYQKNADEYRKRALERRNANIERARETTREYHRTHKEHERETNKAWREAHPEYSNYNRELSRKRYYDNHDKIRAQNQKYHRLNPQVNRVARLRRKALKRQLPAKFSASDWQRALDYFGHKCAVCGRTADFWTVLAGDHWIPLSSPHCPGTIPTNIVPLCHGKPGTPAGIPCCNQSKFNSDPVEWLTRQFGERKADEIACRIEKYFAAIS